MTALVLNLIPLPPFIESSSITSELEEGKRVLEEERRLDAVREEIEIRGEAYKSAIFKKSIVLHKKKQICHVVQEIDKKNIIIRNEIQKLNV